MFLDIVECLLQQPVDGAVQFKIGFQVIHAGGFKIHAQTGKLGHIAAQSVKNIDQSQGLHAGRMDVEHHFAHIVDGILQGRHQRLGLILVSFRRGIEAREKCLQADIDRVQVLGQMIVQVPGDPVAFDLLGADQLP